MPSIRPKAGFFFDRVCSGKKGTALTIGGFDGPHRGHQALFDTVLSETNKHSLASGVVTFTRSPGAITKGSQYFGATFRHWVCASPGSRQ